VEDTIGDTATGYGPYRTSGGNGGEYNGDVKSLVNAEDAREDKMKTTVFLCPAAFLALALALAWPVPATAECDAYKERLRIASRDLKEFERYVLQPLRERRGVLEEELRREVEGPERLERKIASLRDRARSAEKKKRDLEDSIPALEKKAGSLTARLADLDSRIDDAREAGEKKTVKKLQKERGKAADSYRDVRRKIRRHRSRLEDIEDGALEREEKIRHLRSRKERILTEPPTAAELESRLAGVQEELRDEKGLKKAKEREADFFKTALTMCRDYREMREYHNSYREAVRRFRQDGCPSYRQGGEGETRALLDMDCR
jgi:chromosome segregation ATPase